VARSPPAGSRRGTCRIDNPAGRTTFLPVTGGGAFAVPTTTSLAQPGRVFRPLRAGARSFAAHGQARHFGSGGRGVEPAVAIRWKPPPRVPRTRQYDRARRTDASESIEVHPAHLERGRAIWALGMLALPHDQAAGLRDSGLFKPAVPRREGGHACRSSARPPSSPAEPRARRAGRKDLDHCAAGTTPGAPLDRSS